MQRKVTHPLGLGYWVTGFYASQGHAPVGVGVLGDGVRQRVEKVRNGVLPDCEFVAPGWERHDRVKLQPLRRRVERQQGGTVALRQRRAAFKPRIDPHHHRHLKNQSYIKKALFLILDLSVFCTKPEKVLDLSVFCTQPEKVLGLKSRFLVPF